MLSRKERSGVIEETILLTSAGLHCHACKKKGHLAQVCHSKGQGQGEKKTGGKAWAEQAVEMREKKQVHRILTQGES